MQILVLGMHRSGTSTVARLLNMMGAYFSAPGQAMASNLANPKGYWERKDIWLLNDSILKANHCSWDNVADFDPDTVLRKLSDEHQSGLREIVNELDANRPWMAKDPRFCLLLPVWEKFLEAPLYIYVYRDPIQIAKSIASRENQNRSVTTSCLYEIEQAGYARDVAYFPLSLGLALWEKYVIGMLNAASDAPKILVSYHDMMNKPIETVTALHDQLYAHGVRGLHLPSEREILAYLDPSLYHQKEQGDLKDAYMTSRQVTLADAFERGELWDLTPTPSLSSGAQEILNEHRDRLRAARAILKQNETLEQHVEALQAAKQQIEQLDQHNSEQAQQITAQTQKISDYQRQLETSQQEADHLRRNWQATQSRVSALEEKEQSLLQQQAEKEQSLLQQQAEKEAALAHSSHQLQQLNTALSQLQAEKEQFIHRFNTLVHWVDGLEHDIDAIFNSLTWRIGDGFTQTALRLMLKKPGATAKEHIQAIRHYLGQYKSLPRSQQHPLSVTPSPESGVALPGSTPSPAPIQLPVDASSSRDYATWIKKYDSHDKKTLDKLKKQALAWPEPPLISVIMPVYNTPEKHLKAALDSVLAQVYPHWELCVADDASPRPHVRRILEQYRARDARIKIVFREQNGHISAATHSALELAGGEFMAFMDHDDVLAPHALFAVAQAIRDCPGAMLLYSDEDKIDEYGRRQNPPHFKPAWSPALLLSYNFVNHLAVYRSSLIRELDGPREGFEGAQDYDLLLRAVEKIRSEQIVHIPRVLYHWRISTESTAGGETQKPYAQQAAQQAIREHLQRMGVSGEVSDAPELLGANRVRHVLPDNPPLVSLIIPTYNGEKLLRQCLNSIAHKTDYPNYEILIVDNDSDDPATLDYFRELEQQGVARVMPYPHPFNYAAINNKAVKEAHGELICLLNNDVEVISPGWLSEMVGHVLQPGVGAVGARLWYPNETLQHGGVIVGLGGVAGHSHKYFPRGDPGYFGRTVVIQNFSAVTAACMVLPREVYLATGGMEENKLQVAFNDVDFCLKIGELGLRIVWTPYAELYHHESISRGQEDTPEKLRRFQQECRYMKERWGNRLLEDPAYSPNLTLDTEDFAYAWPPRVPPLEHENAAVRIVHAPTFELTAFAESSFPAVGEGQAEAPVSSSPPQSGEFSRANAAPPNEPSADHPIPEAPLVGNEASPNAVPPIPPHLIHRQPGYQYLGGQGLEIGAFNQPALLPETCQVEYCDARSKQEIAGYFTEIDPDGLVEVQHVFDLDTEGLSAFPEQSQDFVILNHVLEHVANPIRVLEEIFRVLKPGGHAVLSIPDKNYTFDKHRPLTDFEHLLEEYHQGVTQVTDEHYLDFLHAVHPSVFNLDQEGVRQAVERVRNRREHAHVWDSESFEDFLYKTIKQLDIEVECEFVSRGDENGYEYFSVWRKSEING